MGSEKCVCCGAIIPEGTQICRDCMEKVKQDKPVQTELEGGGWNWWYVCPECHGAIDRADHFCKHCGQAVEE